MQKESQNLIRSVFAIESPRNFTKRELWQRAIAYVGVYRKRSGLRFENGIT